MLTTPAALIPSFSSSTASFTIQSELTSHGRSLEHIQLVTEHVVVTSIGRRFSLFAPGLAGRYEVDRAAGRLRPYDSGMLPDAARIRPLLGEVSFEVDEGPIDVEGRPCRRIRVRNRGAKLVISIDALCTRVEGLETTALARERAHDARTLPVDIPLADDELIVRSTTRALAADFEQSQTIRLVSIEDRVDDPDWIEGLLRLPIEPR